MNQQGRTLLITRPTVGGKPKVVLTTDNTQFNFKWAGWVRNDRLLVSVRFASRRDFVGTVETRLLAVNSDGSAVINLTRNAPVAGSMSGGVSSQIQDQVIDWLPEDGQYVLLQMPEPGDAAASVYKVNVDTGSRARSKAPSATFADGSPMRSTAFGSGFATTMATTRSVPAIPMARTGARCGPSTT
jgi:hypothetical protein